MDNLGCKSTSADPLEDVSNNGERANDGSISVWAWTSAIILASFSICLLAFPRLLLFLAEPSGGRATLTSLEKYLALHLGVILGILAITIVAVLPNDWPTGLQPRTVPSYHPLLRPVTAASLVMALLSDNRSVGTLTTTVLVGSSIVGLFGLWMLVFSGPPDISRKTGADKHTSSFIFGNKSAASVRKRLWKKEN
ncbi:hypothetical protein L210DRAFT_849900 [Boletus edulis BED1]|uniref:Uncharacterized protein n=1 Tax=Boletus edulis BED1 TaxID=1328754 RepID=A0AAD4GJD5_BOLED|nr:hypothetical protein L210DRAFT_849900 [Boletus edulis BED1]